MAEEANPNLLALGTASATAYLSLNATSTILRLLVDKGVISEGEAADALTRIAETTRDDAGGSAADEPANVFVGWLDDVAKNYRS